MHRVLEYILNKTNKNIAEAELKILNAIVAQVPPAVTEIRWFCHLFRLSVFKLTFKFIILPVLHRYYNMNT